jgi:hypothetical protein
MMNLIDSIRLSEQDHAPGVEAGLLFATLVIQTGTLTSRLRKTVALEMGQVKVDPGLNCQ